jgi:hypothetical protein
MSVCQVKDACDECLAVSENPENREDYVAPSDIGSGSDGAGNSFGNIDSGGSGSDNGFSASNGSSDFSSGSSDSGGSATPLKAASFRAAMRPAV